MKNELELEGEQYYFASKGDYKNPYPYGSDEFNAFERGWTQALKRTSTQVSPPQYFPDETEQQQRQQAEQYKNRKG